MDLREIILKTARVVCLTTGLWLILLSSPAQALYLELTAQQVKEAIEYGKAGKEASMVNFSREWTVSLGEKTGWATLYSQFHSLAFKARKAAVERRELSQEEIEKALQTGQALTFSVTVFSDSLYYTYHRPSTLKQGERIIASSYEFHPELCENSDYFPESPAFVAACVYKFPPSGIDPNLPVTLIVVKPTGEELRFEFELSKMR